MDGSKVFSLKNIGFQKNGRTILKDISICVNSGEIIAIVGPSGAGKSTLLFLLNRLNDPTVGELLYLDKNICDYPVTELRRKIGLVMQQPVLFSGTVRDNIAYGPSISGRTSNQTVEELLKLVGLPLELVDYDVSNLSGGEKQRVALARTLANEPDILLLDEPTSALDPLSADLIEKAVINLKQRKGLAAIWVTHSLEQAQRISDKTLVMAKGTVQAFGPSNEVLKLDKGKEAFIGGNYNE